MKKCVKQVCGIDLHIGKMAAVFLLFRGTAVLALAEVFVYGK